MDTVTWKRSGMKNRMSCRSFHISIPFPSPPLLSQSGLEECNYWTHVAVHSNLKRPQIPAVFDPVPVEITQPGTPSGNERAPLGPDPLSWHLMFLFHAHCKVSKKRNCIKRGSVKKKGEGPKKGEGCKKEGCKKGKCQKKGEGCKYCVTLVTRTSPSKVLTFPWIFLVDFFCLLWTKHPVCALITTFPRHLIVDGWREDWGRTGWPVPWRAVAALSLLLFLPVPFPLLPSCYGLCDTHIAHRITTPHQRKVDWPEISADSNTPSSALLSCVERKSRIMLSGTVWLLKIFLSFLSSLDRRIFRWPFRRTFA